MNKMPKMLIPTQAVTEDTWPCYPVNVDGIDAWAVLQATLLVGVHLKPGLKEFIDYQIISEKHW